MKKSNLYLWLISGLILLTGFSTTLSGQTLFCPCDPNAPPYPGMAMEKDSWMDAAGGKFKLVCTNQSPTGDFVWSYCPPGGGAPKVVGRCVYPGGQNCDWDIDNYWVHICRDPNSNCAIVDIFCIDECRKITVNVKYNSTTGCWEEETSFRKLHDETFFASLDPTDSNDDGIPDEGFNILTDGLYPFPPPPLPAEYATRIGINLHTSANICDFSWDIGLLHPTVEPGDYIILEGFTMDNINSIHSGFTASNISTGLQLTVIDAFAPATGDFIASLSQPSPQLTSIQYFVVDPDAKPFYQNLFSNHPAPIEEFDWSCLEDFSDMPGYISTAGVLFCQADIPTLSEWGLILLTLLLITLSAVAILQTRSATVGNDGAIIVTQARMPIWDKKLYLYALRKTLWLYPIALVGFYLGYGFLQAADFVGTLFGVVIITYLVHYILMWDRRDMN